jgi:Fic family protein
MTLEARLLERISQKKSQLDALHPLPPTVLAKLQEVVAVEWTYNSNAIEGNTLTLRETQYILETGLTVGGKSLRDHLEVTNHHEAIAYVESIAHGDIPITPFVVRQIHALVLKGIDDEVAGRYRDVQVYIAGSAHRPPYAWEVPQAMDKWGAWLSNESAALHPVEVAALAHHTLAAIHPFVDGNGRTARLVMNLILLRYGYPPSVIQMINRRQYYTVLAEADSSRARPLVNFVGRAVERTLTLYVEASTPRPQKPPTDQEWIPLRDIAAETPYSQEYLSLLARRGQLEAVKRGRVWYTTRQAVAAYQASVS